MKLSGEQLQFLDRFSKSPDGQFLLMILRAKLAERDEALRKASGEDVYRTQGRAVELDELIADIIDARDKLNRSMAARPATRHQA
jgi:hypothetical protein